MKNVLKTNQNPASKAAGKFREYANKVKHELNREIPDEEVEAFHAWQFPQDNFGGGTHGWLFGEADQMTSAATGQQAVNPYDIYQGGGYAPGYQPQYLKDYDEYVKSLRKHQQ